MVNVFVHVLLDDPPSLAGHLIHTFMDKYQFLGRKIDLASNYISHYQLLFRMTG
jgi:hypothetical protein